MKLPDIHITSELESFSIAELMPQTIIPTEATMLGLCKYIDNGH